MNTKKSLGQNFFINKNLCEQISQIVLKEKPDIIIEIGPGTGSFTKYLNKPNVKLHLIEKDDELYKNLQYTYSYAIVENCDFLEWDLGMLKKYKGKKIVFFGSLPYNISKQIIRKIIESEYFQQSAFFIIQKEVADKYISKKPTNSLLSLNTQIYAHTKRLFNISPDSFRPKPKVNSSFVVFTPRNKIVDIDLDGFNKFLKICFTQPRKTLRNNLKQAYPNIQNDSLKESINNLLSKRPQHLSFEEFLFLYNNL